MTMANQTTEEKTKFTPGPWIVSRERFNTDYEGAGYSIIAKDEGNDYWFIATIEDAEEAEANASLIAASPDMYEALNFFSTAVFPNLSKEGEAILKVYQDNAKSVLIKANGGTNL
jgi:hypothetical protein